MPLQGGLNEGKNKVEHGHCDWAGAWCTSETPWQDNRMEGGWPHQNQSEGGTTVNKATTHLGPNICHLILLSRGLFVFVLRPIHRVQRCHSERYRSAAQDWGILAVVELMPPIVTCGPMPHTIQWANGHLWCERVIHKRTTTTKKSDQDGYARLTKTHWG